MMVQMFWCAGTSSGVTAGIQVSMGCLFLVTAHLVMLPAATCTAEVNKLIGGINELRYYTDESGKVTIASSAKIMEAECLNAFIRETNGGTGMGIQVALMGKVTYDKITRVATTLITTIPLLAGVLAPAGKNTAQNFACSHNKVALRYVACGAGRAPHASGVATDSS